jgi:hypothetical protein
MANNLLLMAIMMQLYKAEPLSEANVFLHIHEIPDVLCKSCEFIPQHKVLLYLLLKETAILISEARALFMKSCFTHEIQQDS